MITCACCDAEYEVEHKALFDGSELEPRYCPFCGTDHKRFAELDFETPEYDDSW